MTRNLIAGLAAMAAIALLLSVARQTPALKAKGIRLLSWPPPMRWFAALMVPGSLAIAWMAAQAKPSEAMTAAIVAACFLIGAAYLAYSVFLYRVWWTTEGIGSAHPFGRTTFIPWGDVAHARYVGSVQAFYIEGDGRRVWYSPMQSGLTSLHRYLRTRAGIDLTSYSEEVAHHN